MCLVVREGVDGRLNSVFGHIYTKNYSKIKTSLYLALVLLLCKLLLYFILVTYNFEQVIVSRNYFSYNYLN